MGEKWGHRGVLIALYFRRLLWLRGRQLEGSRLEVVITADPTHRNGGPNRDSERGQPHLQAVGSVGHGEPLVAKDMPLQSQTTAVRGGAGVYAQSSGLTASWEAVGGGGWVEGSRSLGVGELSPPQPSCPPAGRSLPFGFRMSSFLRGLSCSSPTATGHLSSSLSPPN